jgi:hypothetical protein
MPMFLHIMEQKIKSMQKEENEELVTAFLNFQHLRREY